MTVTEQKKQAALAAIDKIPNDAVLGVGTGSTTNYFIDALPTVKSRIKAVLSSSKASTERLRALGFIVDDPNQFSRIDCYVDGADEFDPHFRLIKGGGGAMTGERIIASMAKEFICIVDESKSVKLLGKFPVAVEVLHPARSAAARRILALGGDPVYREGCVTDWGNPVLDVYNFKITDAVALERELNQIPGVIGHGLFATCLPQVILEATPSGVKEHRR
jgi:ribose 5-phosphate isomerase A